MKFSDGQSKFLRVFNFAILCYSEKLDAHAKYQCFTVAGKSVAVDCVGSDLFSIVSAG